MKLYHDSQNKKYRNPIGAVSAGTTISLSLLVEESEKTLQCFVHFCHESDKEILLPMDTQRLDENGRFLTASSGPLLETGLCWYYFIMIDEDGNQLYYGNNDQRLGGEGAICQDIPPAFQVTVYKPAPVPQWYKDSIVYQIFPDRFARSDDWLERQAAADRGADWNGAARVIQQSWNDTPYYTKNPKGEVTRWPFFGGTLQGIREHLLYLKSMGVGAIYLNPIFTAFSNHKYDTADYMEIDPSFGTKEDFHSLAQDAGRLGIRLILDGVFNHTGADSKYFNQLGNFPDLGACQGPDSPYYSWYQFNDFPEQYQCWWGVTSLPSVEETNPEYQDFIYGNKNSVIRHWLLAGAAGWRLDVADELPDSFIAGIRDAIRETKPDGLLMGEVWEDASNKISYGVQRRYLLGDELDCTMNYPVRDLLVSFMLGRISAEAAVQILRSLEENYPREHFYSALNLIGSHDRIRILTLMGDAPENLTDLEKEHYRLPPEKLELAKKRLEILSLIQFILPGVPAIYYGDEAGLQGYEDPYNRGAYPWGREDQELLAHYRMLAALRKQYTFLSDGDFQLSWQSEHVLICRRTSRSAGESIVAVINRHLFGGASFDINIPEGTNYTLELLSSREITPVNNLLHFELPPLSAALFYCSGSQPEKLKLPRTAGVLCHITSLPSGKLDHCAESFIDYLSACGQKLWQILPLNPTDLKGNSPYSSPAVFAGNIKLLGPIQPIDLSLFQKFCKEESLWLDDFALYSVLKVRFHNRPWQEWPEAERHRKNLDHWRKREATALERIKKEQFLFWARWQQVKDYANSRGISIIGDLPLYAGTDSADTWAHPEVFLLGQDGYPLAGAGVPPDYFNEDGQNWGNPLYDWDALKKADYTWWEARISRAMRHFDYIRLDHFRSFSSLYAIPRGKIAKEGCWLPGVGKEFFERLTQKLGPMPLLAEDLGLLDNGVRNLLKITGCPGMLVYQFSAEDMEALPDKIAAEKIFYTGTHDNQTLAAWCKENTMPIADTDVIIKKLYQSSGAWVITPLQDLLGLGDESRMNVPGKAEGNWSWRASASQLTPGLSSKLKQWTLKARR